MLVRGLADVEPDFETAKKKHMEAKSKINTDFKQSNTAALLLGIDRKVFAMITGNLMVNLEENQNPSSGKTQAKVNIGLRLKQRTMVKTHLSHPY